MAHLYGTFRITFTLIITVVKFKFKFELSILVYASCVFVNIIISSFQTIWNLYYPHFYFKPLNY